MEPVADILDEIVIRYFAWRYAILGWAAYIILGMVLVSLVSRLLAAHKRLHSSHSSFGQRATNGIQHDFSD